MGKESHGGSQYGTKVTKEIIENQSFFEKKEDEILLNGKFDVALDDRIYCYNMNLPGTLDIGGIGNKVEGQFINWLKRDREYIGNAYYKTYVEIPSSWKNKYIELSFMRCMWESMLFIDGIPSGSNDSLCVPHIFNLSDLLTPGRHCIEIRVDNSDRDGASIHGYGTHTQIIWNGILGDIKLTAKDRLHIKNVKIYPLLDDNSARVDVYIRNEFKSSENTIVNIAFNESGDEKCAAEFSASAYAASGETFVSIIVPFKEKMILWDCFKPYLYSVKVSLNCANATDTKNIRVGLRTFEAVGNHFYLNRKKIYLRGTHDGLSFCLTGCPAWDKSEWVRIIKVCKDYGLNHIRYHSVCPPQVAFEAADEQGFILQAELPYWGDVANGWRGTAFLQNELIRILDSFGNYASFCLFSMGNEHPGDWKVLEQMVKFAKGIDNRRLYTATSNEYINPNNEVQNCNPGDDYVTAMYLKKPKDGSERKRIRYMERYADWAQIVEPDKDYDECLGDADLPVIAHEIGCWWTFPDFDEALKYNGCLKQSAYELYKQRANRQGILPYNKKFHIANGKLSSLLYKEDIEKQLKSKRMAGFQLLDLHDYPGQNAAVCGILDSFWESKGLIDSAKFLEFCNDTVILMRTPKYTYFNNETLKMDFEVYRYAESRLDGAKLNVTVKEGSEIIYEKCFMPFNIENCANTHVGEIQVFLNKIEKSTMLTVCAQLDCGIKNSWNFWVYPVSNVEESGVIIADNLNDEVISALQRGENVLFLAKDLPNTLPITFNPPPFTFTMFSRHTCGLMIDDSHEALSDFPTSFHSDFQWEELCLKSRALPLLKIGAHIKPIVLAIDDPIRSHLLGTIVEFNVLNAKIIVVTHDIQTDLENRPAARQLRKSLLRYLKQSCYKQKGNAVSLDEIKSLLASNDFFESESPKKDNSLITVSFSKNLDKKGIFEWEKSQDDFLETQGFSYEILNYLEGYAIDMPKTPLVAFSCKKSCGLTSLPYRIRIHLPKPEAYSLYLKFDCEEITKEELDGDAFLTEYVKKIKRDKSDLRRGIIFTDNDGYTIGSAAGGKWICAKITQENCKNGYFELLIDRESYGYELSASLLTELILK